MMTSLESETRRYRTVLVLAVACVGLAIVAAATAVAVGAAPWTPLIIAVGVAPFPALVHAHLRLVSAHARRYTDAAADRFIRSVAEVSQSLLEIRTEIRTTEASLSLQDQHTHKMLAEGFDQRHRCGLEPAMARMTRAHQALAEQIDALGKRVATGMTDARREIVSVESRLLRELDAATAHLSADVRSWNEGVTAGRLRHLSKRLKALGEQSAALADSVASLREDAQHAAQRELELLEAERKATTAVHRQLESGFLATRVSLEQMPHVVSQYQAVREAAAPGRLDLPAIGGWAITAPVVSFIAGRLLMSKEPLTVLELGSGVSTLWSAMAIARVGQGRCVSLDHDEGFAARTAAMLAEHGVSEYAQVIHSPLADVELDGRTYHYYDLSVLPDDLRIDILLVDGPPAVPHEDTRFPALPLLFERLNPDAEIVVDDTIRIDEKSAIRAWQERYPNIKWQAELGKATLLRLGQGDQD